MNDRNAAINWAKSILDSPDDYYILDTETTGLESPEIIELGIINLNGKTIVNQRFNPKTKIENGATQIHGLTNASLQNEPSFDTIADRLQESIFTRKLLIYNFPYDEGAIWQTFTKHSRIAPTLRGECVMQQYSQFVGEWNDYRGSYRWQKLPGGDHSAIGDCQATLAVIKHMAASPMGLGLLGLEQSVAVDELAHT